MPGRSSADQQQRAAKSGAWNSNATIGTSSTSVATEQQHHAEQLADVDRRPRRRRQQQRPQRLAVALALERPAQRQRSGERDRDPQDAGGGVLDRLSLPCTNANEKISTHETAKKSVVVRISQLFSLDGEVLLQHEQRDAEEHRQRRPTSARGTAARSPARAGSS